MPKIAYEKIYLNEKKLELVAHASKICEEYARQGIEMTLRSLYYKFVARDLFPNDWKMSMVNGKLVKDLENGTTNNIRSYKKLQDIINDARIAGMIDWKHVTDSTRFLRRIATWNSPQSILNAVAEQYKTDKWNDQPVRIEVWVEKDTMVGVVKNVCNELEVPFLSCRGFVSQSELWESAQRMLEHLKGKQTPVVIHLGDHDPSGIDMSRDITRRLALYAGRAVKVDRIALNMDQVKKYNLPPNPAKSSDSRYTGYADIHGDESWEIDALDPLVIAGLIRTQVLSYRDQKRWDKAHTAQESQRTLLTAVSSHWEPVTEHLREEGYVEE